MVFLTFLVYYSLKRITYENMTYPQKKLNIIFIQRFYPRVNY